MGTVNKIVSIVILVLTIGAAAMSFLLCKKREVLVSGWDKMAGCINQTASSLDLNSGTKTAGKLQKTNLAHTNYEKLDSFLTELPKQAKEVITQRDSMAEAMKEVASTLELEVDAEGLKTVNGYNEGKTKIIDIAKKSKTRNDSLMQGVVTSCQQVGVKTNVAELKDFTKSGEPIAKFNTQVKKIMTRVSSYENHLGQLASAIGASAPSLAGDDFETSLKDTVNAAQTLMNNFEQTKKDLANEKDRTKTTEAKLEEREQKIVSLEKNINNQTLAIADLKNKIKQLSGGSDSSKSDITILENGDPRLLKYLKGKVVEMNDKWDFVVIDLGKVSKVKQQVGKKEIDNEVTLPANSEMVVARNLGADNQFVGKIRIIKVNDNCALANVLPSPKGKSSVQVGDTVFFSDDSIDNILKGKEAKKAEEKKATEATAKTEETSAETKAADAKTEEKETEKEAEEKSDEKSDEKAEKSEEKAEKAEKSESSDENATE